MSEKLSRGLRNHNPLNIRKTKDKWVGLSKQQTDPAFFVFTSDIYGLRAGFRIIRNYVKRTLSLTLAQMVVRWAPPNENDTKYYIQFLSNCLGVPSDIILLHELNNESFMVHLLRCMAKMESGVWLSQDLVTAAYYMEQGITNPKEGVRGTPPTE